MNLDMSRGGLLAVALLWVAASAASGQVNLGAFGGVNRSDLSGDAPPGAKYGSSAGLAAGLVGEFHLGDRVWISFQPMYLQRGADVLFKFPGDSSTDTVVEGLALDYVALPVMAKFVSGNGKTYAAGGLDVGYLVDATLSGDDGSEDVKGAYKDFDVAANFAFGAMLPIGRTRLTLEARYAQSLVNVSSPQRPTPESLPVRARSSGLQLLAGLLYPLGGEAPPTPRVRGQAGPGGPRRPQVGAHAFLPNNVVPGPFVQTYIRNSIGVGRAIDVEIPVVDLDSAIVIGHQGNLVFAALGFEYQHAIRDWLAARGEFRLLGRLGTDVGALLASGVTAGTAFEFGWLFQLYKSGRTMLSASLDLSNNGTTAINLVKFVGDVIDGRPAQLVSKTPSLRGGGGLRFAWGASPLLGVTLQGDLGYGESVERTAANDVYVQVGGALDLDFSAIGAAPIGLVLGGKIDSFPEGGGDIANAIRTGLVRIAYNGRSEFVVALDLTFERFDSKALGQSVNFGSAGIGLRYYF